jgi:uncharacterized OB-fold protein
MTNESIHPSMNPASYWRASQNWHHLLGKEGVVIAMTTIYTPPPHLANFAPYCYGIVEVAGKRHEVMGLPEQVLQTGDQVKFVLRRTAQPDSTGIIAYGLKVAKI